MNNELIDLSADAIRVTLKTLLMDKTTKKNIIWATVSYEHLGPQYEATRQITEDIARADIIRPRIAKALEHQAERTKSKGEVFTPAWICNQMNNFCDEEWFGRKDVFNVQEEQSWKTNLEPIIFYEKDWKSYVDSRRIEITCGEAPYLVSRYDTSTGKSIPVEERIGILDRKLRVVKENASDKEEWFEWTVRAFQSVYGYEYQGDNLLIARINMLLTFCEYMETVWGRKPDEKELKKVANVISWNIWQMDGLTGTVPLGEPIEEMHQISLFELFASEDEKEMQSNNQTPKCRIFDWRADRSLSYESIKN